ncbi:MAG TPA: phosphotransferase [Candidatus Angelobacter sp.]|jgi:hypothetical protein|nr:phosphotransferase [Candidatus Angelobacter sp.]
MLLNSGSVAHYLLQRGLMTYDSVVDGDLLIVEAPRRNRSFKIIRRRHPGLLVKQVQQWDAVAIASIEREASVYSLAQTVPEFSALAEWVPGLLSYDSQNHLLVLESLPGYESLAECHQRLGRCPVEIAETLAEALGRYHYATKGKLDQISQVSVFPKMAPWILSIHQHQPGWFQSLSAANSQLLEIVKKYDQFATTLDHLRAQWEQNSLIHGDISWDNCLIQPTSGTGDKLKLRLIDWELADVGDELWDVGAVLQSYLSYWILSIPTWPGATAEQVIARASHSLEVVQASISAFWDRYKQVAEIPAGKEKEWLRRSISYGAARMIQSVYEAPNISMQMNPNALYLLQVSMNILLDPQTATRELFGIKEAR